MKIRYSKGFSLSLWSNEIDEVIVTDDQVKFFSLEGKWIKVQLRTYWTRDDNREKYSLSGHHAIDPKRDEHSTRGSSSLSATSKLPSNTISRQICEDQPH